MKKEEISVFDRIFSNFRAYLIILSWNIFSCSNPFIITGLWFGLDNPLDDLEAILSWVIVGYSNPPWLIRLRLGLGGR